MRKLLIIFILLALSFSATAELPEPQNMPNDMILGEVIKERAVDVTMRCLSGDGLDITEIPRSVIVRNGESIVRRALSELFDMSESAETVIPGDARIDDVIECGGIITVKLLVDEAGLQGEQEILLLYASVCETLMSIDGVSAVNILVNDRQESINDLPIGVLKLTDENVTMLWAQYLAEAERMYDTDAGVELKRSAVLYFPSNDGQWIIPEIREMSFVGENYPMELLNQLIAGTTQANICSDFLTSSAYAIADEPKVYVNASGERVMDVYLSDAVENYIALKGLSRWQLAASITSTMCAFIPELDAVKVFIDNVPIESLNIRGNARDFESGYLKLDDFCEYIGSVATVYYGNGSGGLVKVLRALSPSSAMSPYLMIKQLLSGPTLDEAAYAVIPPEIDSDSLLGVKVDSGVAYINFTYDFYRLCQTTDSDAEALIVYSIVNTLCELSDISSVKLLIEGEQISVLSNEMYLKTELLPNAGIVSPAE